MADVPVPVPAGEDVHGRDLKAGDVIYLAGLQWTIAGVERLDDGRVRLDLNTSPTITADEGTIVRVVRR